MPIATLAPRSAPAGQPPVSPTPTGAGLLANVPAWVADPLAETGDGYRPLADAVVTALVHTPVDVLRSQLEQLRLLVAALRISDQHQLLLRSTAAEYDALWFLDVYPHTRTGAPRRP